MERPDQRIGTTLANRYRIEDSIGVGGMGVVYRATRIDADRTVAIKFLQRTTPDLLARFQREVAAASRLSHPHLADILDSGEVDGLPYLVMEFAPGTTLKRVIALGPMKPERAVGLTRQILAGIHHAHTGGVVHRDLKPDNVILLDSPAGDYVKVLDFGLAKIVRGAGEKEKLTVFGIIMGTPGYMAPEQARSEPTDRRADIYSVGVMLYEMVVGRKPFIADNDLDVIRMHISKPPVPPRTAGGSDCCSPELEGVILRALEKQPSRRFATAEEFSAALEKTPDGKLRSAETRGTVAAIRRARDEVREVQGSSSDSEPAPALAPVANRAATPKKSRRRRKRAPQRPKSRVFIWAALVVIAIILATTVVPFRSCVASVATRAQRSENALPFARAGQ